ncbi:RNA helicase aquarius [Eumeta japonica]|uniref:RNA helicase aquarius n=1 Tax=Eumeta variegata TaxID=151549 RepID=A0A4C1SIT4_EUMVA|nr:RNA helicase aquarius [Eumeta japonica]
MHLANEFSSAARSIVRYGRVSASQAIKLLDAVARLQHSGRRRKRRRGHLRASASFPMYHVRPRWQEFCKTCEDDKNWKNFVLLNYCVLGWIALNIFGERSENYCYDLYAALKRSELVQMGFKYDNILMEESAQILEIETFIPLLLQNPQDGRSRLKRWIMIGDHHQLPPS